MAENASFRFGGEASLPLHYFSRLRDRGIEAWLIVHGRNKAEIEALLPEQKDRVSYIADEWFHRLLWNLSRYLPRRISESSIGILIVLINQYIQCRMVRELTSRHEINVIHQPIPVSPRAPSFISGLGVPVIIGPMNGGMDYPPAFRGAESWSTRISVALARRGSNLVNRLIPGKRLADFLLVANPRTRLALPACVKGEIIEIPENGVDLRLWTMPCCRPQTSDQLNTFLFIGRLVDWKRLDFVIRALERIPGARLEVIGDGPMREEWTTLAASLGLAERVEFLGWLPQKECAGRLHCATALLLPSIYECGGAVVLEAMATGTPAIATAWGGPAEYIDDSCGILVEPTSAESMIDGFTLGMRKLIEFPELRRTLGDAGRKKIEAQFDWEKKVDRVVGIYHQLLNSPRHIPA